RTCALIDHFAAWSDKPVHGETASAVAALHTEVVDSHAAEQAAEDLAVIGVAETLLAGAAARFHDVRGRVESVIVDSKAHARYPGLQGGVHQVPRLEPERAVAWLQGQRIRPVAGSLQALAKANVL